MWGGGWEGSLQAEEFSGMSDPTALSSGRSRPTLRGSCRASRWSNALCGMLMLLHSAKPGDADSGARARASTCWRRASARDSAKSDICLALRFFEGLLDLALRGSEDGGRRPWEDMRVFGPLCLRLLLQHTIDSCEIEALYAKTSWKRPRLRRSQ